VFRHLPLERTTPERCIEAYYLQRTRFEGIAERKLRRRQLTEDGNLEISGRDFALSSNQVHWASPNRASVQESSRQKELLPGVGPSSAVTVQTARPVTPA
jgi:hypothetical protein